MELLMTRVACCVTASVMLVLAAVEGDWLVSVLSLDAEAGGLGSQAVLTVFATDGKSISSPLGHPGIGLFRSGACDQFTVSDAAVVMVREQCLQFKIQFRHDHETRD